MSIWWLLIIVPVAIGIGALAVFTWVATWFRR